VPPRKTGVKNKNKNLKKKSLAENSMATCFREYRICRISSLKCSTSSTQKKKNNKTSDKKKILKEKDVHI